MHMLSKQFISPARAWRLQAGGPGYRPGDTAGGFTLVELLVVMAIFGIVMGGIYTVFVRSNRVYVAQEELVAAQQEARAALEILGREIRMAGYIADRNQSGGADPINAAPSFTTTGAPAWSGSARAGIGVATATSLAFESDLDGDGYTEAVLYLYNATAGTLTREALTWDTTGTLGTGGWNSTGGGQLFLENLGSLTFTYQMVDGSTTSTPTTLTDIRGVTLNVTAQTSTAVEPFEGGKRVRSRQLVSRFQMRNMGL